LAPERDDDRGHEGGDLTDGKDGRGDGDETPHGSIRHSGAPRKQGNGSEINAALKQKSRPHVGRRSCGDGIYANL
jgi:hypothetical protein